MLKIIQQYDPDFRASMKLSDAEITDPAACIARAEALPEEAQDLLDTLLLAHDAGTAVAQRFRPRIESAGQALWGAALLLPQVRPSKGVTVDPRHYAASCRTSPHLSARIPFGNHLPRTDAETPASLPPADARRDAIIMAALLDRTQPGLTKGGNLRADAEQRLYSSLGDDSHRWSLALHLAKTGGLARPVGDRLLGFPESPLRRIPNPEELLAPEDREAALVLLRAADSHWLPLADLLTILRDHARWILHSPDAKSTEPNGTYADHPAHAFDEEGWDALEAPSLHRAADVLVRLGHLEARQGPDGPTHLRVPAGAPQGAPGFLVTPDLDILVAPGELPLSLYGRLCRLAPYVDGDRAHRHRLSREGIAADISAGHSDAEEFLSEYARFPLPESVVSSLAEWGRSAARVSLWTGLDVWEEDGVLVRAESTEADRTIEYQGPATGRFEMKGDDILVPLGLDSLRVRSRLARIATSSGVQDDAWHFTLRPDPVANPESLLSSLRTHTKEATVPPQLEAAIWARAGGNGFRAEEALVVHLPENAAEVLQRDPIAGPLLGRMLEGNQSLVNRDHLPALRERLEALGFQEEEAQASTQASTSLAGTTSLK
jgi:hypothetical protein